MPTSPESRIDQRNVAVGGDLKCSICGSMLSDDERLGVRICMHCIFRATLEAPVQNIDVEQSVISDISEGIDVLGRYVVGEEIGRGGMGIIFRGRDRTMGQTVALKRILPEHARCPETLARFEREAQSASSLIHPHLLPVYEVGHGEDGSPFFSMELAGGGSLQQCKQKYRGRWRQTAELLSKICGAVQIAHDEGILHRDLKPGNILFNEDYEPLVADFGLAKRFTDSSRLTGPFVILGTPSYVAPEQAAGESEKLTPAADVYSLGAIFYELLTGQIPIADVRLPQVFPKAGKGIPRRPRQLDRTIPRDLEVICMRCLRTQPSERYQSAQALSADLERWLSGKVISRPSVAFRLWNGAQIYREALCWCAASSAIVCSLLFLLTNRGQWAGASGHPATFVVTVDDVDPNSGHSGTTRVAAQELRCDLSKIDQFRVLDPKGAAHAGASRLLDPASFGRSLGAEYVLAGNVRYGNDGARIILRLLRSDTGDVLWYSVRTIPTEGMAVAFGDLSKAVAKTLRNKWQETPRAFSESVSLSTKADAVTFFYRAKELTTRVSKRDLDAAIKLFRRAIAIDPHFGEARSMLAYALTTEAAVWMQIDQLPSSLIEARAALACNPYSALAHRALGNYYFLEADYPRAVAELWEALQLNPSSAGNNMALGDCLREMGNPGAAIRWQERAAKLDPVHYQFNIAEAESFMILGQDKRAQAALDRGAQLNPDQSDTLFFSSVLCMWQQNYEEARRLCSAGRAISPENPDGLTLAAMIDFFAGKGDRGRRDYEELRNQNRYEQSWPYLGSVNPSSALACLARERGETAKAQQLIREALDIDDKLLTTHPHNCRILHDIAATLSAEGNSRGAMEFLRKAIAEGWVEHRSTANDPRFGLLAQTSAFTSLLSETFPRPLQEGTEPDGN